MKPILYPILAAIACGFANGQTAFTNPVGYVTIGNLNPGVAGGANAPAGSDTYISVPLDKTAVFSGAVDSVDGQDVTFAGTPFASPFDISGAPHVLKVETGPLSGAYALISSNTSSVITVDASAVIAGLGNGDKVTIRPAWTLGNFFSNATLPSTGVQLFAFNGAEVGVNIQPNSSWAWDGSNWISNETFEADDNAVLYPGEALVLRNESETDVPELVVSGEIFTSKARQIIVGDVDQQDNPFAFQASAGEPIATSGFDAIAAPGDAILVIPNDVIVLNKSASKTYDFDGTNWIDSETFEPVLITDQFQPGAAYIYRRSAEASTATVSDEPDYVGGL